MLFAVVASAFAAPDVATLKAAWAEYEPALKEEAVYPLSFTDEEWAEVAAGKVARRRERLKGTDRVIGLVWADADLDTAWVAVQDSHVSVVDASSRSGSPAVRSKTRSSTRASTCPGRSRRANG